MSWQKNQICQFQEKKKKINIKAIWNLLLYYLQIHATKYKHQSKRIKQIIKWNISAKIQIELFIVPYSGFPTDAQSMGGNPPPHIKEQDINQRNNFRVKECINIAASSTLSQLCDFICTYVYYLNEWESI